MSQEVIFPPAKRQKLVENSDQIAPGMESSSSKNLKSDESQKEALVGIRAYVHHADFKFKGVLKTRYTDFLVNEILQSGEVLHLRSTKVKKENANGKQPVQNGHSAPMAEQANKSNGTDDNSSNIPDLVATTGQQSDHSTTNNKPTAEPPSAQISDEIIAKLTSFLDEPTATKLVALYNSIHDAPDRKPRDHPTIRFSNFTNDRVLRAEIHQFIRISFAGRIESSTDHEGVLILNASPRAKQSSRDRTQQTFHGRGNKLSWADRGGEYLHFTMYKENKDTMEIISHLTRQLKTNAKNFAFAGTKDRRAVTVQRCSAFRIEAERLAGVNRGLWGASLGDYQYKNQGLELGELAGNEFVITLRECEFDQTNLSSKDAPEVGQEIDLEIAKTSLRDSMKKLHDDGFLNYYGLQRFGTFSTRTDVIGRSILKGDFKGACDAILHFGEDALEAAKEQDAAEANAGDAERAENAGFQRRDKKGFAGIGQDDILRAKAINHWRTTNRLNDSLNILPRKFSAEGQIIRHLTKQSSDHLGALMNVQRNLRLMYVHAYQSYVWNLATTKRWETFGSQVVEGDLVLVNEHKDKEPSNGKSGNEDAADADGEIIVEPEGADKATSAEEMFERAQALTADEAASGLYSIHDIVLPQPGYDIEYPQNAAGLPYYQQLMAEDGLDPLDMRRRQRDWSLSGSYRKMIGRIGKDWDVDVKRYDNVEEQFVETDVQQLKKVEDKHDADDMSHEIDGEKTAKAEGSKIAAVFKFQLSSSQYATMALRELSKAGVVAYKPDFSGGR